MEAATPEIITNSKGQKVRHYTWDSYRRRLGMRKELTRDVDLNGKTLVINHCWGIGDILYSTPALYGLKKKYPRVKIVYISRAPEMLEDNPYVDRAIHFMDYDATEDLFDHMEDDWYWLNYDTPLKGGLDYKHNLRTKPQMNEFMVSLLRKSPSELNSDESDFVKQASVSVIGRYKQIALDMYCQHAFIGPDDLSKEERTVYYYPKKTELNFAKSILAPIKSKGYKIITLMPHASTIYKDYPHWKEVTRLCSSRYYWLVLDSHVRQNEPWIGANISNLSGAFKLREAAALVIEADLNCSSDTGLLYCKASRGGKCVVTYGPHHWEPFLHYFPSAVGLRVPYVRDMIPGIEKCCASACFIDTSSCKSPGTSPPCLQQLSPRLVADEITKCLEEK